MATTSAEGDLKEVESSTDQVAAEGSSTEDEVERSSSDEES
jgi:hypothetical protein